MILTERGRARMIRSRSDIKVLARTCRASCYLVILFLLTMERSGKVMPIPEMNVRRDNYSQLYFLVDVLLEKLDKNRQLKRSLFRRMEALSNFLQEEAKNDRSSPITVSATSTQTSESITQSLRASLNSLHIDQKIQDPTKDEEASKAELTALKQENLGLKTKIKQIQLHNSRMVQLLDEYEDSIIMIVEKLRHYIIQKRQSSVDKLRDQNEKLYEKRQEVNRLVGELLSYQENIAEKLPPMLDPLKQSISSDSSESELRDSFQAFYLEKYAREALAALYSDK